MANMEAANRREVQARKQEGKEDRPAISIGHSTVARRMCVSVSKSLHFDTRHRAHDLLAIGEGFIQLNSPGRPAPCHLKAIPQLS